MNLLNRLCLWKWLPAVVVVLAVASLSAAPQTGRADDEIVSQLAAIEPIDTHLHAYQSAPALADFFARFNLRALNITLIDDRDAFARSMEPQWTDALAVRRLTKGRASVSLRHRPVRFRAARFRGSPEQASECRLRRRRDRGEAVQGHGDGGEEKGRDLRVPR